MPRMLIPERGLTNTRRNRRWLAIVRLLEEEVGMAQEETERVAWSILRAYEKTA